jgi:hypothetical protein
MTLFFVEVSMRIIGTLFTAAAAITLAGCSTMVSLHPFVTDHEAAFDPSLVGVWASSNGEELYIVRQDGHSYKIRRIDGSNVQTFSANLLKLGDLRILDLISDADDPFQVMVHTPIRVWMDGGTLRFATLDTAWLKENARKQIATEEIGDRSLITGSGDAVLRLLTTYGAADKAFENPVALQRQP